MIDRLTTGKVLALLSSLVVLIAVSCAIYKYPPSLQRQLKMDSLRVNHLRSLDHQVESYWRNNKTLPLAFTEICPSCGRDYKDPETGQAYEYEKTGDRNYRLCAVFSTQTEEAARLSEYDRKWAHAAGRVCFDDTVPVLTP